MQGIAKSTTVCRVCGAQIVAGIHTIRWAPAIKGSARHLECYGKPDKFDYNGKPIDGPATGLENVVGSQKGTPSHNPIPVDGQDSEPEAVDDGQAPWDEPESSSEGQSQPASAPSTQNPADIFGAMAAAMAPFLEQRLKGLVDEKKVKEIVQKMNGAKSAQDIKQLQEKIDKAVEDNKKAIEEAVKKEIEDKGHITIEVKDKKGEITKMEGLQHKDTPKLLRLMMLRKNIYLPGPTGSGKSTAARKCAAAIKTEAHPNGLPFYYVSLNPQSSPTRIEGFQTPHGEYVMTQFRKAYSEGGVFCADEVDNSMANLWTSINNAIDSDLGSFPDGMVTRHPDFIFVGTGNTNLSGDAIYRDRKALDKATISRFVFLYWEYDANLEKAITLARNNKAMPWMNWVHRLRKWAKDNNPSLYAYAHPRSCYDGADLLGAGFTIQEAMEMTVFKSTFDETAKKAALAACPVPQDNMALA